MAKSSSIMFTVVAAVVAAILIALTTSVDAQSGLPKVGMATGSCDKVLRGDFIWESMDGAILACGGSAEDVAQNRLDDEPVFNGTFCDVEYYCTEQAEEGGTGGCDSQCALDKAVEDLTNDLILGVSFFYAAPLFEAASQFPARDFGIIDVTYDPVLENVETFIWREDQMGFLAGIIAANVALDMNETTVGIVGGVPIPPVKKFVNGFVVGAHDACPQCQIYETYSSSFGSLEEGEQHADEMIKNDVAVAACGGGFTGSMACKKMAQNGIYVIGVDVDEYYTTFEGGAADGSEYLLTSMLKSTNRAVQYAIQCFLFRFEDCAGRVNLMAASNAGIGFADCHDACDVFNDSLQLRANDLFRALAEDAIQTGVDIINGDLLYGNVVDLSSDPLYPPSPP